MYIKVIFALTQIQSNQNLNVPKKIIIILLM